MSWLRKKYLQIACNKSQRSPTNKEIMLNQEEQSFNKLVRDHHASIYRICRAYLYDTSHADDLYQDILFQLWRSIKSFKGNSRVSTWVYRVAVNTAITFNTRHKKHHYDSLPDEVQLPYEDTLDGKREQEVEINRMRYCISLLEKQDRLVISLVLEDKSYKDIAEITGNSPGNIGVKINSRTVKLLYNEF
jgi:RNA polymerase sigma factor (sigma-70 family)